MRKLASGDPDSDYKIFFCPGCNCAHTIPTGNAPNAWEFNGSNNSPSFKPSILMNMGGLNKGKPICHSWITDGRIEFFKDSTHALSGQTVELPDLPKSWLLGQYGGIKID